MNNLKGKLIEGVYASYPVTSHSEKLLKQFSVTIQQILNEYPVDEKPEYKTPSHYHLTTDYKGDVDDIGEYVNYIRARKKESIIHTKLDGVGMFKSNTNNNGIIYATPQEDIKLELDIDHIPHITLVKIIENTTSEIFWKWFEYQDIIMEIMKNRCLLDRDNPNYVSLELDTSKIQIYGKIEGKKELIVEV